MKSNTLLTLAFLLVTSLLMAQEIKFKRGIVLWDGVEVMEYRVENMGKEFYLYKMGKTDEEEIVLILYRDNNTDDYKEDDYNKIIFSRLKRSYEISQDYMFRAEIVKLIRKKVIGIEGTINETNMESYIEKFDEELPRYRD